MRKVIIDFTNNGCYQSFFAGYTGEHNATELHLIVPKGMIDKSDNQVVVIQSGPKLFRVDVLNNDENASCIRSGDTIHIKLDKKFTRCTGLAIQVEFYKNNKSGEVVLIAKTPVAPNVFLRPSPETQIDREEAEEESSCKCVQADHAQNDPKHPAHIKNRLAYYGRKFEDIIPAEYEESVLCTITTSDFTDNYAVKIAELPEETTPLEVVKNFVGLVRDGEEIRFYDKKHFSLAERAKMEIINFGAANSGAMFCRDGLPIFIVTNVDNLKYALRKVEHGETYVYRFVFPEKGIYAPIIDSRTDENSVVRYKSYDRILFSEVQRMDESFLPVGMATIYDIPTNPDVLEGFTYENEELLYNGKPIKGSEGAGEDGLSAYEIAVKNGFEGTEAEWLTSLKGDKGDKGDNGKAATINGENAFNFIAGYGLTLVKSGTFHVLARHTEWKSENNPTSITLLPYQTTTISSSVEHLEVSIDNTHTFTSNMFETDFAFVPSENCELIMPTNVKWAFDTPPQFKYGYIYYIHIKKVQHFYIASFVEVINL